MQKRLKETDLFPEKLPQHHSLLPGVTQRLGTRGSLQGTSAPRLGVQDSAVIACYQVIILPVHLRIARHISAMHHATLITAEVQDETGPAECAID